MVSGIQRGEGANYSVGSQVVRLRGWIKAAQRRAGERAHNSVGMGLALRAWETEFDS